MRDTLRQAKPRSDPAIGDAIISDKWRKFQAATDCAAKEAAKHRAENDAHTEPEDRFEDGDRAQHEEVQYHSEGESHKAEIDAKSGLANHCFTQAKTEAKPSLEIYCITTRNTPRQTKPQV